ncbi:multicopper oxidase family protein [Kitasatospora sp. LaBMicrA B282]|uniref:multicopper oxidase family protein n=1 Tax=Kitasatospora sp. LaBMicrA B282 TaxID=3420949 RepID=UPI003D0A0A70
MSERANGDLFGSAPLSRRRLLLAGCLGAVSVTALDGLIRPQWAAASALQPQTPLRGATIPKYVTALPTFRGQRVSSSSMTTSFVEFAQHVLPPQMYPPAYADGTWVWGYQVGNRPPSWPGCTVEAFEGRPTTVRYVNRLPGCDQGSRVAPLLTVDRTLHWADPLNQGDSCDPYRGPIPAVAHLHGGEVSSAVDGGPQAWFTAAGQRGSGYATSAPAAPDEAVYRYPNAQPATTLWFHDHALGVTRLNVYAGLAAFYLVRDRYDTGRPDNPLGLPADPYEVEIAIQDREFDTNGQLLFPDGTNPDADLVIPPSNPHAHPYWIPSFLGDAMVVNGRTWPVLAVEPRRYRFRILNGCNGRYLSMSLTDAPNASQGNAPSAVPFWQIGTDGGLLDTPVELNTPGRPDALRLMLSPAERADVIIDFGGLEGRSLILTNTARHSFPTGPLPDPSLDGQIMRIDVNLPLSGRDTTYDPATGTPLRGGRGRPAPIVRLADPVTGQVAAGVTVHADRQLVINEPETVVCTPPVPDSSGTLIALVNNSMWTGLRAGTSTPISGSRRDRYGQGLWLTERPRVGATEVWEMLNSSTFAHPMHLHLVQFQVLNRQDIDVPGYLAAWAAGFPGGTYEGQLCDGTLSEHVAYPPGVVIPGYGPPSDYLTPNADGALGGNPAFSPHLTGPVTPPDPTEAGWKDTVNINPGQVTRVIARWAPTTTAVDRVRPGRNLFPFDPTEGPGYVWHCHIIDHEDNEMMRPYAPTH